MAEGKFVDPFEAFKNKKATEDKQKVEQAKLDEANKKSGWVDGIGPATKQDPTKPKGFNKGRYQKPPVNQKELENLRPDNLEATRLANPEKTDVNELPPEDKRRPKKFGKY